MLDGNQLTICLEGGGKTKKVAGGGLGRYESRAESAGGSASLAEGLSHPVSRLFQIAREGLHPLR